MSDLSWTSRKYDLFSLHVNNLPTAVNDEGLKTLFAKAGDVKEVYIAPDVANYKSTYAFVRYLTLAEVNKAIGIFNNTTINGITIQVSIARATREKLNGSVCQNVQPIQTRSRSSDGSIVRNPMPRMEPGTRTLSTGSKERDVHQTLKSSLHSLSNFKDPMTKWLGIKTQKDTEDFMYDFKNVLVGMSSMPESVSSDCIKIKSETPNIKMVEECILRYHKQDQSINLFKDIDIDLTDGNDKLTEEDNEYFFNSFSEYLKVNIEDLSDQFEEKSSLF